MHEVDLTSVIQAKNTLVISCVECNIMHGHEEGIYVYTSLANTLQDKEAFADNIKFYVEEKGCKQVIIAGHLHCNALHYIRSASSTNAAIFAIKSYLTELETENYIQLINVKFQDRFVTELNILKQAAMLMQSDFVAERVKSGDLLITGVMYDQRRDAIQTIFSNGLTVNTLITMN
jgi:carbonic anhydrase